MNIQQMKYAVAIANNGSFREAAKKLYIAQPSLSHAMKELEEELHTKLFIRTNRGANLTVEGMEFVMRAQKILTQFESLETRYLAVEQKDQHFSISSQHYNFLAPVMSQLLKEELNYQTFRIFESTTQKVIEDVSNFRSELGIIFLNARNQAAILRILEQKNLNYQTLLSFKTHIYVSHTHPLAKQKEVSEQELHSYVQVRFSQEANHYSYFAEDLIDSIAEDRIVHVNDRATLNGILQRTDAYSTGSGFVEQPEKGKL
ncbi:MAG: LysR family transcriptional regulator [Lactobacillales bacterium]|jgi:DNA-binding transcriptional LysR family regulator|nr:LysR family transcriptional regulator [Lactobacillales bacterium]